MLFRSEAIHKNVKDLLDHEKTIYYERMAFIIKIPTITDIINHVGSVQHVDWLYPLEKLVFKNAFECDPFATFRYAKQRQKYLCQGQSLNFFIPDNDNTESLLSNLMTACVLDEDILSQYYVYTRSGIVISDECVACSA